MSCYISTSKGAFGVDQPGEADLRGGKPPGGPPGMPKGGGIMPPSVFPSQQQHQRIIRCCQVPDLTRKSKRWRREWLSGPRLLSQHRIRACLPFRCVRGRYGIDDRLSFLMADFCIHAVSKKSLALNGLRYCELRNKPYVGSSPPRFVNDSFRCCELFEHSWNRG